MKKRNKQEIEQDSFFDRDEDLPGAEDEAWETVDLFDDFEEEDEEEEKKPRHRRKAAPVIEEADDEEDEEEEKPRRRRKAAPVIEEADDEEDEEEEKPRRRRKAAPVIEEADDEEDEEEEKPRRRRKTAPIIEEEDEYEDEEEEKPRKKGKGLIIFLTILLILSSLALAASVWELQSLRSGRTTIIDRLWESYSSGNLSVNTLLDQFRSGDNEKTIPQTSASAVEATEASVPESGEENAEGNSDKTENSAQNTAAAGISVVQKAVTTSPTQAQTYENDENGKMIIPEREAGSLETEPAWQYNYDITDNETLNQANKLSAMYDYDAAIALLQSVEGYESIPEYTEAIASYETAKSIAVPYSAMSTIPHVFFHSLVVDTSRAFNDAIAISPEDGSNKVNAYNYVMTTVDEFCRILEEMYSRGYVLVSIYDIASYETKEDGTAAMQYQDIVLPPGKKPFILSVDDVSYYQYMMGAEGTVGGQGFPTRLLINENGKVVNEYEMPDGTYVYGSYDVVPILDDFIETHPDFSYHGAKGIIALTGYNGILGYRTSDYWYNWSTPCLNYQGNSNEEKRQKLYHNNENIEEDKKTASEVAAALKAEGWLFASHTWGHNVVGDSESYEFFVWDADMWNTEVAPLIGGTDIIIYPQGADLYEGCWRGYDPEYPKYAYLKNLGFSYFCNVDSNLGWTQLGTEYYRMGRANLDGQRMWEAICSYADPESGSVDRLSELFDSRVIFDWSRPTPVVK